MPTLIWMVETAAKRFEEPPRAAQVFAVAVILVSLTTFLLLKINR
jgi:hypothetical protein